MVQFAFNNNALVIGISPFFANYKRHLNFEKSLIKVKPTVEKAEVKVKRL
jgi:hypothetical protein